MEMVSRDPSHEVHGVAHLESWNLSGPKPRAIELRSGEEEWRYLDHVWVEGRWRWVLRHGGSAIDLRLASPSPYWHLDPTDQQSSPALSAKGPILSSLSAWLATAIDSLLSEIAIGGLEHACVLRAWS